MGLDLKKLLKREISITAATIAIVATTFLGITLAIYRINDNAQVGTIALGSISFSMCQDSNCSTPNLGNVISGEMYPMNDAEGLALSPYSFLLTNTGNQNLKVSIYATTYTNEAEDYSNIRMAAKESTAANYNIFNFDSNVIELKNNISLAIGESKIINILAWGNEELGNEMIGKTFHAFINAIAFYYPNDPDGEEEMYIANVDLGLTNGIDFSYTRDYQSFVAPISGYYKIEAWGASGGSGHTDSVPNTYFGKGGYTSGNIYLNKDEEIYIYVGGAGGTAQTFSCTNSLINADTYTGGIGGYNGGGAGGNDGCSSSNAANDAGGGGGGGTDIRLVSGTWDDTQSLNSRIMVAGGGGGSTYHNASIFNIAAGDGGGLVGEVGGKHASETDALAGTGGTQIAGNFFGKGANGIYAISSNVGDGGGGGGYYGAVGHTLTSSYAIAGGGGSSFISGYAGVAAIIEGSTSNPRNHKDVNDLINTIHYSEKYFVDGEMKVGVNSGNGRAKVSYVGLEPIRVNTALNNVRYIKDCINGSEIDSRNHWVELQAISKGTNVAKGKIGTLYNSSNAVVAANASYPFTYATDGNINNTTSGSGFALGSPSSGNQCFVIDLEQEYNLDEIAVWHYWTDNRVYNDNVTSVSSDGINWTEEINIVSYEKSEGKRVNAYEQPKVTQYATVTYNCNGGSGTMSNTTLISGILGNLSSNACNKTSINNTTITYSVFLGWSEEPNATVAQYTDGQEIMATDDLNLYAVWGAVNTTNLVTLLSYTGNQQVYEAPLDGIYQVETWGAQGGNGSSTYIGGKGGYSSGKIYLNQGEDIYIYVGGQGPSTTTISSEGGYNGGGNCFTQNSDIQNGCGGGATDVRYGGTTLNDRIMVAGGGGGSQSRSNTSSYGGGGGNLVGEIAASNVVAVPPKGGTQIAGGATGYFNSSYYASNMLTVAGFGYGGGYDTTTWSVNGGGGGYYGGGSGVLMSGGGGSSFISGYAGAAAIIEGSVREPREHTITYVNSNSETVEIIDTLHYSGKYFVDGKMEAGVNSGNGKALITYLGSELSRIDNSLNDVRYIKDCINGAITTARQNAPNNHWVELQAISNGTNVAKGKIGTLYNASNAVVSANASYPFRYATDGDIDTTHYACGATLTGAQCFVIDLGSEQDLEEVAVWHYWADERTYNNNVTYVAGTDGIYREVINFSAKETASGKKTSVAYSDLDKKFVYDESEPVQKYIVPTTGTYKIETWGAQGGFAYSATTYTGGYGGYSVGDVELNQGDILYIYVGGRGANGTKTGTEIKYGGFNGGGAARGTASKYMGGGGGATHISTSNNLLSQLSGSTSDILIVAGGGGGANYQTAAYSDAGGSGGGYVGANGKAYSSIFSAGGTQSTGNAFGLGGGAAVNSNEYTGSGGGYWGGTSVVASYGRSGAGGSGYIGNNNVSNKSMYCYNCSESTATETYTINTIGTSGLRDTVNCPDGYSIAAISKCAKSGNGSARITYLSE